MKLLRAGTRCVALFMAAGGGLALTGSAFAHAHVSPPVVVSKEGQVFTLAVPTEEENVATTKIELTPPSGFSIDSFAPVPGWKREVQSTGSGEETTIQKVTWSGGNVPHEEASMFQFLASTDAAKTYSFKVRQTYSNGTVVDWSGPESSDTPAPTIESKSSLSGGGGGGSNTLGIVAVALAVLALVAAVAGLVGKSGRRTLA
jgi:uncharacterized protein YcnI